MKIIIGENMKEEDKETGMTTVLIVIVPKGINTPAIPKIPPSNAITLPNFFPTREKIAPMIPSKPQSRVQIDLRYMSSRENPMSSQVRAVIAKFASIEVIEAYAM